MTATIVASRGRSSSLSAWFTAGESSSRVTSTSVTLPCSSLKRRTSEPTLTASSVSAVSRWGVDTATSTPQFSLNSHSFWGWLTRATMRGTANSWRDSSEITRLSSSSPVAAITTSQVGQLGGLERAELAGVGDDPGDPVAARLGPAAVHDAGLLLEHGHRVARVPQLPGDEGADVAARRR